MQINRKQLQTNYILTVENITVASTGLAGGRTAVTPWAANAEVMFKGQLQHILMFAIANFSVNGASIAETFHLVSAKSYQAVENLTSVDVPALIDLDPTEAEGIILAEDVTFLQNLSNNYRLDWNQASKINLQEKATPTTWLFYRATLLQLFCFAMQDRAGDLVRSLYEIGVLPTGTLVGVDYVDILSSSGPVELEQGHVNLANVILGA